MTTELDFGTATPPTRPPARSPAMRAYCATLARFTSSVQSTEQLLRNDDAGTREDTEQREQTAATRLRGIDRAGAAATDGLAHCAAVRAEHGLPDAVSVTARASADPAADDAGAGSDGLSTDRPRVGSGHPRPAPDPLDGPGGRGGAGSAGWDGPDRPGGGFPGGDGIAAAGGFPGTGGIPGSSDIDGASHLTDPSHVAEPDGFAGSPRFAESNATDASHDRDRSGATGHPGHAVGREAQLGRGLSDGTAGLASSTYPGSTAAPGRSTDPGSTTRPGSAATGGFVGADYTGAGGAARPDTTTHPGNIVHPGSAATSSSAATSNSAGPGGASYPSLGARASIAVQAEPATMRRPSAAGDNDNDDAGPGPDRLRRTGGADLGVALSALGRRRDELKLAESDFATWLDAHDERSRRVVVGAVVAAGAGGAAVMAVVGTRMAAPAALALLIICTLAVVAVGLIVAVARRLPRVCRGTGLTRRPDAAALARYGARIGGAALLALTAVNIGAGAL